MQADLSLSARFCSPPPFAISGGTKPTAAQRAGTRYEEKAVAYLEGWAAANGYSPLGKKWIEYRDLSGRAKFAEVDFHAVSKTDDNVLLFEIKLRHTRDAFAQLARYKQLLQQIYPKNYICPIEFCRYFDPDEHKTEILSSIRPHNLPHAAVIWEPSIVGLNG